MNQDAAAMPLHLWAFFALEMDSDQVDEALRIAKLDPATCTADEARAAVREYFQDNNAARFLRSLS